MHSSRMPNRITLLRKLLGGISQADLARRLRVNQSTVSRLENGAPLDGPILTAIEALEASAAVAEPAGEAAAA